MDTSSLESSSLTDSYFSEDGSTGLSFNNNCSWQESDATWIELEQEEDINWSAADPARKPLLSDKAKASGKKVRPTENSKGKSKGRESGKTSKIKDNIRDKKFFEFWKNSTKSKTKDQIKGKTSKNKDRVSDKTSKIKGKVSDKTSKTKGKASDKVSKIKDHNGKKSNPLKRCCTSLGNCFKSCCRILKSCTGKKSSSAKYTPLKSKKKKKKKKNKESQTGFMAYVKRIAKSEPSEHRLAKAALSFPLGLLIIGGLFRIVIVPQKDLDPEKRNMWGSVIGLILALGFAFSVQLRCIILLVIPVFFGKYGRNYVAGVAVVILMAGPVNNIITNSREIARSLSCLSELLANHTVTKWKLRLNPLKEAMQELQEEGYLIKEISGKVKAAFKPMIDELEDQNEVPQMEQDVKEVEDIVMANKEVPPNTNSAAETEQKHEIKDDMSEAESVQEKWKKKLELRCQDVFGKGVLKCRQAFGGLHDKCMDALWIIGYVLCLPLKMTFFCELVKIVPGILGLDCDSADVVQEGFATTYVSSKGMISELGDGMQVDLQYRLTDALNVGPDLVTAKEIKATTMHHFEEKSRWIKFLVDIVTQLLPFAFLFVVYAANGYYTSYMTKFQHDNIYVTAYFRRIDARRKAAGKNVLFPLKKTETQILILPSSTKFMGEEKNLIVSQLIVVVLRFIVTGLIVFLDYFLVWILDVIYRNSLIEYHQTGMSFVNVTVRGKGFMSDIVRMFLTSFSATHKLDDITTNTACLPRVEGGDEYKHECVKWSGGCQPFKVLASKTGQCKLHPGDSAAFDQVQCPGSDPGTPPVLLTTIKVFAIQLSVFLLVVINVFGTRVRRLICAFHHRKREKKRILYLYNELLKKRKGYLRHMRHKIRKQVRQNQLKGTTGVMVALTLQFPRLCGCLKKLSTAKDACLVCKEPEGKTFQRCPTKGCNWGYCKECWKDIKRNCYACGGKSNGESGTDPDDVDDGSSDTDYVTDDEKFLK